MANIEKESTFDKLIDELQSRIDEDESKVFSGTAIAEARNPSNMGTMEDADGVAERTGSCGDNMRFYVKLEGDRVAEARFVTDGCGATTACGSMLARTVEGMTIDGAMAFCDEDLIGLLDGLPDENLHCARLAVATLHGAVRETRTYKERPDKVP
jgi:nitrogen fixation NifU-like protein